MAERGKAEESQRIEASGHGSHAERQSAIAHIYEVFGEPEVLNLHFHPTHTDPPKVTVAIETEPTQFEAVATDQLEVPVQTTAPDHDLLPAPELPLERDDAYYDEVRQAVGRGTPSVLLGTSTKSLERSLEKLWVVHGASGASQTASRPSIGTARAHPHPLRHLYGRLSGSADEAQVAGRTSDGPELPPPPERPSERSSTKSPTARPGAEH